MSCSLFEFAQRNVTATAIYPPRQSELVRVESTDTIPKIGVLTYKRGYIHLDLRRYNGVYCDSGDRLLAFREGRDFNPLAKSDRSVPPVEHMKLV